MDQQNHLFSLISVFLALGIGILVGASMGENALVLNQIDVIESLRNEIVRYKDEMNIHFSSVEKIENELSLWKKMENEYFNPMLLENRLESTVVKVFVQGALPDGLDEFLYLSGCQYYKFIFKNNTNWEKFNNLEDPGISHDFEIQKMSSSSQINPLVNALREYPENSGSNILKKMQDENILEIETDFLVLPVSPGGEYTLQIIITGSLEPYLNNLIEEVGRETVFIRADFINEQELDTFYGRMQLLEAIESKLYELMR
ncbi:MAG: copper transporter [Bacillota bacterium]|nr:copper transporter [Bacillota bacterium]